MRLAELASHLSNAASLGDGDINVSRIIYDSREAGPGSIFFAIPGLGADGHDYLRQAIERGVAAVAVEAAREAIWRPILETLSTPAILMDDTRSGLAVAAAALNGFPARQLGIIGITGTDGKTSLSHLVDHILSTSGRRNGLITTAECRVGNVKLPDTGRFTTPESPELQAMLAQVVNAGGQWAVLEATSHGLAQHRLDCCEFDIAAVTVVGSDHLDFHGSREAYVQAKGRLFQFLDVSVDKGITKTAVLNFDDPIHERYAALTRARVVSYGVDSDADFRATSVVRGPWRTSFTLTSGDVSLEADVASPALFSVYNAIAATAICVSAGMDVTSVIPGLTTWKGAPGRMELIDEGQPFGVVVDFAHAPDSLERVLAVLRTRSRGRLIAVFGCIGERDRDRRFAMGAVAARDADFTIVTDDNPYSEDRDAIIAEIVSGLDATGKRAGHDFAVIPDRREAIAHAIGMAVDEDTVLLAGKGHETKVHLPGGAYECDDREVARSVLHDLLPRSSV